MPAIVPKGSTEPDVGIHDVNPLSWRAGAALKDSYGSRGQLRRLKSYRARGQLSNMTSIMMT